MLKVGTIGFGGGSALIPVVEKELVHRRGMLDEQTYTTHTVIANLTPGALPVKLGALAGAHAGRAYAAVLCALAVALPGSVATVALLASFSAIGPEAIRYVEFAAVGVTVFVLLLLAHYIGKVLRNGHRFGVYVAIMIAAFMATGADKFAHMCGVLFGLPGTAKIPALSAVGLIAVTIILIGVYTVVRPVQRHDRPDPEVAVQGSANQWGALWCLVLGLVAVAGGWWLAGAPGLRFLGLVAGSTVTSFGGGEAYVGVADGFFVSAGLVDQAEFYGQLVPVANALPGPILVKIASGLGYSFGLAHGGLGLGLALATAAFVAAIASCSAIALLVMAGYDRFAHSVFLRRLGSYILPVICGLLLTTSCAMVNANADIGAHAGLPASALAWGTLLSLAALWWAHRRWHLNDLVALAVAGGTSLVVLSIVA